MEVVYVHWNYKTDRSSIGIVSVLTTFISDGKTLDKFNDMDAVYHLLNGTSVIRQGLIWLLIPTYIFVIEASIKCYDIP